MIPTEVRAVCFDAVGTLIFPDPPAHVVYAEVAARHGSRLDSPTVRERFRCAFALEEQIDRNRHWQTSEEREHERWRNIVAAVLDDVNDCESCFHELFARFGRASSWRGRDRLDGLLDDLSKRGYRLAIASNYDQRLRGVVLEWPELHTVHHLIISSEIGYRKPSPRFFEAVCEVLQLSPRQILFVGDDPINDIEGARGAGMHALQVNPVRHEDLATILFGGN